MRRLAFMLLLFLLNLVSYGCAAREHNPQGPRDTVIAIGQMIDDEDWKQAEAYLSPEWYKVNPEKSGEADHWTVVVADKNSDDTRKTWTLGHGTIVGEETTVSNGVMVQLKHKDLAAYSDPRPGFLLLRKKGGRWMLVARYDRDWKPGGNGK